LRTRRKIQVLLRRKHTGLNYKDQSTECYSETVLKRNLGITCKIKTSNTCIKWDLTKMERNSGPCGSVIGRFFRAINTGFDQHHSSSLALKRNIHGSQGEMKNDHFDEECKSTFTIICRITSIAPGTFLRFKTVHCTVCSPAVPLRRHKAWDGARTRNAGYDVLPLQGFRVHKLPNSTFICTK
jgi:hypothetical protein